MNDLATDAQLKLMDKMNIPYDFHTTTKAEAHALIDKAMQGNTQGQNRPKTSFSSSASVNTQNYGKGAKIGNAFKLASEIILAGKTIDEKLLKDSVLKLLRAMDEVEKEVGKNEK